MALPAMSDSQFDDMILLATRQGNADALQNHLSTVTIPTFYLNRTYECEHAQKCTLLTIACLNGHEHVARMLLDHFEVDLHVLNDVSISDSKLKQHVFLDVPVLWTAASIDNFKLVQLLVEHGAQVNQTTKTNSTPFRAACYNGNVIMARYLVEHGANTGITKENNDTNLMVSACHKRYDMVAYLVDELHCDVNVCDKDGRSALYDAVNCGSLELVEYLLKHGARNFRATIDGMSPFMWAAEKRRADLMAVISPQCSLLEQIEAEELLGSAFVCGKRNDRDLSRAFEHFNRALELRNKHDLPKPWRSKTHELLANRQECETTDDLRSIQLNLDRMYIEALLVRERVLGITNSEYRYSLCFRGAILFDDRQYQEGMCYWIHELRLCQEHSIALDSKHLRNFGCLFSEMLHRSHAVSMEALLLVLKATMKELEHREEKFDFNFHTLLFLITIASQFLYKSVIPPSECEPFYRLVCSINRRRMTSVESGMSLLHLSLNSHTEVNDYLIKYTCKYPCLETVRTLLRCGADVNTFNSRRHTPLQLLVSGKSACDEALFNLLCDAGAHLDYANALGETPMDMAAKATTKQLLRSRSKLSLKCLCARFIRKESVPFHGKIALSLVSFVEKH